MATKTKRQDEIEDCKEGQDFKDVATKQLLPHLPDLAIHKILRLLPTKSSVRMSFLSKQWDGVWSSTPALDFDEGNIDLDDDHRSRKFIHIWDRYMEKYGENENQILDKFRLRMRYFVGDGTTVDKWLKIAIEKGVKELDISLPTSPDEEYFCLSLLKINFNSAKFITSLHLECVTMKTEWPYDISIPSLKALSLKKVFFPRLRWLMMRSRFIEYLSLTSCDGVDSVLRSSLKSLEIINCNCKSFEGHVWNLESFTMVSSSISEGGVEVESNHLRHLAIRGLGDHVKAKITTSNLKISFSGYNLKPNSNLWDANITLPSLSDFDGSLEHYSSLRDYLAMFDCCKELSVSVLEDKDIIFPEYFRRTLSTPLPNVQQLTVTVEDDETEGKTAEIKDCLFWMAPAAAGTAKITRDLTRHMYMCD